jgi:hypothetical protein
MGPRNAYKDMLDNVASPITCVEHESPKTTRTNGKWGHVRYRLISYRLLNRYLWQMYHQLYSRYWQLIALCLP